MDSADYIQTQGHIATIHVCSFLEQIVTNILTTNYRNILLRKLIKFNMFYRHMMTFYNICSLCLIVRQRDREGGKEGMREFPSAASLRSYPDKPVLA